MHPKTMTEAFIRSRSSGATVLNSLVPPDVVLPVGILLGLLGGGPRVVVSTAALHDRVRG